MTRLTLLLGLALIAVASVAGPRNAPPLYDGICPAVTYQYLSPPPGSPVTDKPRGVTKVEDLSTPTAAQIVTDELPPQAQVIFPAGALTGKVTFSIQPVPPPATAPPNGTIDGNVYDITATDARGSIAAVNQPMSIVLRSPDTASILVLDIYRNGAWTTIDTTNIGCANLWLANTKFFGKFAVIHLAGNSPPPTGSTWTAAKTLELVVGVLVVIVAVIVIVRAGRRPGVDA